MPNCTPCSNNCCYLIFRWGDWLSSTVLSSDYIWWLMFCR
jgi:hypothetical protein